jgi:hypothetical protein
MDANVAALRDELIRLTGPARLPTLIRLGQHLVNNYWRAGPGRPDALADLSAAIETLDEAYNLLDYAEPARGQIAGQLGYLLAARHGAHGSGPRDRDTGLHVLNEALSYPHLPPMQVAMTRISLGQLHMSRVMEAMNPTAARGGFLGGLSPSLKGDADEAVRRFKEVVDGPAVSAELTAIARTLLTVAEAMRTLLGGDLARLDLGTIMQAMAQLQALQQNGAGSLGPLPPYLWDIDKIDNPLDYPVTSVQGDPGRAPTIPPRQRASPSSSSKVAGAARRLARQQLTALAGEMKVWEQARALLRAGPDGLASGDLDALVGAAENAVDAAEADDALEVGFDLLLSAVGLCLRDERDGSGWGVEEYVDSGPRRVARQRMLAAAQRIPPAHPAAAVVAEALRSLRASDAQKAGRLLAAGRAEEAFTALESTSGEAPSPADVSAALREIGAGALVYPQPTGMLCLDAATGRLDIRAGLPVTDPQRILVAGDSLVEDVAVSHVASGAEVIRLAARPVRPVGDDPLFLVNPRGDRDPEMADVLVIRRLFYPRSACLGRALEPVDAAGTAADLLARLPAASLVHLACGLRPDRPALLLSGDDELDALPEADKGGLVIFGAAGPASITDAFLGAGFSGVIGWLRPVPPRFAALAVFLVHLMLVERRLPPADAVAATKQWLRDPDRDVPSLLPAAHLHTVTTMDLTQPELWAALAYRGR